jgi:hypothetical protein
MKKAITKAAMIAAVTASGARLRRGAFPDDADVTGVASYSLETGSIPQS